MAIKPHTALSIAAFCVALSGCNSNSEEALSKEVSSVVSEGMDRNFAVRRLVSDGFKCGDNYEANFTPGNLECSRTRSYYAISTCMQRVFLTLDDRKGLVRHVATPKPSCTGF